ncbi:hypothetical protein APB59_32835 [Pseudomonas aeruginosa]|nr:hypothetical protein APB46_32735 [Pseudomonas aeruginosa]OPE38819.1 hypothetical protein APB59_32835 [Pseudomonas aeruginosa]RPY64255.1 hypothetical protein IPC677_07365 [Pseudomonas aeruginosa]
MVALMADVPTYFLDINSDFLRHISDGQLGGEPKCPKKSQEEFTRWKQRQKQRRQQRIDRLNNQGV